jgi:PAS domain-containing protein
VAILTDVTERKRIARQLQHSQERVEQFVQTTNDVLWDWEPRSRRSGGRPPCGTWWDSSPTNSRATRGPARCIPSCERVWAGLREAVSGAGRLWSAEYRMRKRDGEYCHLLDRATILRDATAGRCAWSER